MEPGAWARACGAARSLYAARARVARARPSSAERLDGWASEQWPAARSLFLDLRAAADLPRLPDLARAAAGGPRAEGPALLRQRWALPALECLHIIGHGERTPACGAAGADASGPLTRAGRRGAVRAADRCWQAALSAAAALDLLLGNMDAPALRVLSLDMTLLAAPLPGALARLQHLVQRVDDDVAADRGGRLQGKNDGLFAAIAGSLPALRTLHVEAAAFCLVEGERGIDLRPCARLEALALVYIHVRHALVAPEGCRVATVLPVDALHELEAWAVEERVGYEPAGPGLQPRLDALDLRGFRDPRRAQGGLGGWMSVTEELECRLSLSRLAELRIVLRAASLPHGADLSLNGDRLPALRLLVLDVPCALRLRLSQLAALRSLVLIARALAAFSWGCEGPSGRYWDDPQEYERALVGLEDWVADYRRMNWPPHYYVHPWAALFVRTAAPPPGDVQAELRELFSAYCEGAPARTAAVGAVGASGAWQGAAPAGLCPDELRACGCHACVDCLGRAGVPLAAPQAWRRDGFDRLLAPLCR